MKKAYLYILMVLSAACGNMEKYQNNPNQTVKAPASSVLTGVLLEVAEEPWGENDRINQFHCVVNPAAYWLGDQSYAWGRTSFNNYAIMRNVDRIDAEAASLEVEQKEAYSVIADFMRAYLYVGLSARLGDIPFSEAMSSDAGVYFPKYDSQKEVYLGCLEMLDDVNERIAPLVVAGVEVEGDLMFEGNLAKWQKLINSFQLRVLISLSHKVNDADLNVKGRFNRIISDPMKYPVMASNDDNFQLTYYDKDGNRYPVFTEEITNYNTHIRLSATYVELLTERLDPRIFRVASPTPESAAAGVPGYAELFTSYRGANPATVQSVLKDESTEGLLSSINFSHYRIPTGEPTIQVGYAETMFNIAEAVNRGWCGGNAADYYAKGLAASMEFYNVGPDEYVPYAEGGMVVYKGNNQEGLEQILIQKYIAFFENSGLEAYFNYRRTGLPALKIGEATENGGVIPKRWMYPEGEMNNNLSNLTEALQRQYGGSDNINAMMWILQD